MTMHRSPLEIPPPTIEPLARLPLFFSLAERRAVVVGGTPAAAWKTELLSASGATVEVYAADPCDELTGLIHRPPRGPIVLQRRDWHADDLVGAAIAIGAFDSDLDAKRFAAAARSHRVPVNVIDNPAFCDFAFGSIVNRSPLVIGISTDGAAPVFAQAIRARIEAMIPQGFARWASAAQRWRDLLKNSGLSFAARRRFWQLFTRHALQHPDRAPRDNDYAVLLGETRNLVDALERGTVTLVGAGPGDPELLTLRAVRAMQSADIILFDDLVSPQILDFARREARKMLVGKSGHGPACKQDEINALMVSLARAGKRVVRLKGGDPMIFGRAGEEIDACRAAGIAVECVPGITAAQAAASRFGISLTRRLGARRVQYVTGHAETGALPADIDWHSIADPAATTAVYMPKKTIAEFIERAITAGLEPTTPAIAVARLSWPNETFAAGSAAMLPSLIYEMEGPVLVIIGDAVKHAELGATSGSDKTAGRKA